MNRKKTIEENPLNDEVVFISSEGIKCMEAAIENLEQIQRELEKAASKESKEQPETDAKS